MTTSAQPIDQATRELITTTGLGQTLFVEAGAGSGKTTQLVDRIVNLVLIKGVRLANVAAITFTEAAAAELQARIRVRFEQEKEAAAPGTAHHERCRQAIADTDLAAISTLHGFASRLLSEFAIDAGLPPRVRVLDEVSSQLAHEERWSRFVDALYDDPAHEALLVRAAVVGVPLEPAYPRHTTMKDVAVELNQNWDRLGSLVALPLTPVGPVDFTAFDDAVADVIDLPPRCTDVDDRFLAHLQDNVIPEMASIAGLNDPDRKLQAIASRSKPWGKGVGGKAAAWGGDVKGCKELIAVVNDAVTDLVSAVGDEVIRHLLVKIAGEVIDAADARRRDGGLEFHDLLVLARGMLRQSERARSVLHERYTHVLLDEFQDTDPIQIELAMLIAASVADSEPGAWHDLEVGDGRLFFVGDPKQSIYRFRRADIKMFLEARDRFGPDGSWARLVTNFRTVAPILDWVNDLFAEVMAEEQPERQPKYEALVAHRAADSGADHRPVLLGGPHHDPKVKAGVLREAEAADVADVIAEIRTRPERWMVLDDKTRSWRPAELADVTILVPTRTSLPYLRTALEASDIPYRLATGTLVYDTQEVIDALAAVRAIDDPTDELSLIAALRSTLYACSDIDLFTFHHGNGRWDLRREPPEAISPDHPVRSALAHLRTLWEDRWWLTPSALLERLLRERQATLLAFGDSRPADVWRRLRFLVDQARAFEEAGGGGLRAFTEWAELQGADLARVHEPLLPETDEDAVRILTIHGSKGLEFPITILSGMTTQLDRPRMGISVLWNETGPPEVKLRGSLATANHEPRANLESEMDEHEKLRLLYVAATRARDHLVVSCHHKVGNKAATATYAGRIWDHFGPDSDLVQLRSSESDGSQGLADGGDDVLGEIARRPTVAQPVPLAFDDREQWLSARRRLIEPQRIPRVISATGVATSVPSAQESEIADQDDDRADQPDDSVVSVRRRGRAGSAIGSAVHAVLHMVDLADPGPLDPHVRQQCDIEAIPEHVAVVASLVRSALASDAVALAVRYRHHKELFVAAPVGDRVIEGYVDLLVDTPDGLVVVDYKTDSARSEAEIDAKLATYALQGASYAVALEAVTGRPVIDCRFVFCRASGAVERSVADLEGAKERVRATLAPAADA